MDERLRASLLWGLAGGLAFLVLAQGARLVSEIDVGLGRLLPVAVIVFAVTAGLGYAVEGRLARNRQV
jgi:hypothetical protein